MKKIFSVLFVVSVVFMLLISAAFADENDTSDFLSVISGEDGTAYINLFELILQEQYDPLWIEYCGGAETEGVEEYVAMLKAYISGDMYVEPAVEAYGDGQNGFIFDCFYINDAESFVMNGDTITIQKRDGSSETHTYSYVGKLSVGSDETMYYNGDAFSAEFECDVYRSNDEAGEFNYFFFRDDTMDSTYHIEFRYGTDIDSLQGYMTGKYAYWLAAGFDADADEETIKNVIELFCSEK